MFYLVLLLGILFDLFTKHLAFLFLQDRINLIGDFVYLQYIENTGIAFSIQLFGLKYITIILIITIFIYYKFEKKVYNNSLLDIAFGLILSGAIGNGLERVFYGKVIDFIGIKYFSIFNLADSFISIGGILYLYVLLKSKKGFKI